MPSKLHERDSTQNVMSEFVHNSQQLTMYPCNECSYEVESCYKNATLHIFQGLTAYKFIRTMFVVMWPKTRSVPVPVCRPTYHAVNSIQLKYKSNPYLTKLVHCTVVLLIYVP